MLRVHQRGKKSQIVPQRCPGGELMQPLGAPRKQQRTIGQTDARYRRLSERFDLTGFEDTLCHSGILAASRRPALMCADAYFCARLLVSSRKPGAMVLPRPAWRNPAAGHRANRSLDPDRGIDVNDDGADQHEREKACSSDARRIMPIEKERREIGRQITMPENSRHGQAHDDGEEQQLLPGVVTPHLRQILLSIPDHVVNFPQPDPVALLHVIVPPQLQPSRKNAATMTHAMNGCRILVQGPPPNRFVNQNSAG